MENYKIYKFQRFTMLIVMLLIFGFPILTTTMDLISSGPNFLQEIGPGQRRLPNWLTYSGMMLAFSYFLFSFIIPAFRAIIRGYIFKIKSDAIVLSSIELRKHEIEAYGFSAFGLFLVKDGKKHFVPYNFNSDGKKALDEFLIGLDRR